MVVVRMLVVRRKNFQIPAARGSNTRGSGARVRSKIAKFSKSSRECKWYECKIF